VGGTYLGCLEQGEAEGTESLLQESIGLSHAHVFSSGGGPGSVDDQAGEEGREEEIKGCE